MKREAWIRFLIVALFAIAVELLCLQIEEGRAGQRTAAVQRRAVHDDVVASRRRQQRLRDVGSERRRVVQSGVRGVEPEKARHLLLPGHRAAHGRTGSRGTLRGNGCAAAPRTGAGRRRFDVPGSRVRAALAVAALAVALTACAPARAEVVALGVVVVVSGLLTALPLPIRWP